MASVGDQQTPRWQRIALWGLQLLLAAAFLSAGGLKLFGHPMMVETFARIGMGQWFRYLTGALEVAGGAGILLPALAPFAAVLLVCIMLGAIVTHLFVVGGSALPAFVLLVIAAIVAMAGRSQLVGLLDWFGDGETGRDAPPRGTSAGE